MSNITAPTTKSGSRFQGLDLLRSIAIFLVVMWHLPWTNVPFFLTSVKRVGWTGVDLFFVLSGYLIGSQLLRPYAQGIMPSFRVFYFRRFMRVMPAYLFVLSLYFIFPGFRELPNISPLWRFLAFTQNFGLKIYERGAFSHVWSLCVEEHFYLTLPIVIFWLFRKPQLRTTAFVVGSIFLFGFLLRWVLWAHYLNPLNALNDRQLFAAVYLEKIYYPTYTRLDGLLVGVSLAAIQLFRPIWWNRATKSGNALLIAGLAVLGGAYPICEHIESKATALFGYPLLAIGFGLLVGASVSKNGILARCRVWGASIGATLAYSTYLNHKEVMHLDQKYLGVFLETHLAIGTAIYAASVIAVAALLYVCIERPFLRLRERLPVDSLFQISLRFCSRSAHPACPLLAYGRSAW